MITKSYESSSSSSSNSSSGCSSSSGSSSSTSFSSSKQMIKINDVDQLSNDFNLSLYDQSFHHKDLSDNNNNNNYNNYNNNKLHNNLAKSMITAGSTYPFSPYYSISSPSNLIQSHTYSYCDSSSFQLRTGTFQL